MVEHRVVWPLGAGNGFPGVVKSPQLGLFADRFPRPRPAWPLWARTSEHLTFPSFINLLSSGSSFPNKLVFILLLEK